jgi:hypothetical protein
MSSNDMSTPSRRNLLLGLGAGSLAAAAVAAPALKLTLPASAKTPSWWDRMFLSLRDGGVQEWSTLVGQSFVMATGGSLALKLIAVKPLPSKGLRPKSVSRSQGFVAVFESAATGKIPTADKIYQLTHHAYSPLEIYMSPVGIVAKKAQFVAVFN